MPTGKARWLPAIAALGFGCAGALAQSPSPKPSTSTDIGEPDNTEATFGDWTVRCVKAEPGRACELIQTLEIKGQGAVARVAVGRLAPKAPLLVSALLPVNIAIPGIVQLASDERDESPLQLDWKYCNAAGCLAQGELKEDFLRKWQAQNGHGFIRFLTSTRQPLALLFSFRGFAAALDSLARASNPPNAQ